ncbi:CheR family methyltransferase [Stenotrophomonas tumulicola]|uniref:Protein-glutamate O-methyltransferase CheR n=1 Tax=Stenotrophomonas tumulicola TaxID=1685415 RepID=A0A7W3FPX0_9GAMM|nr:CheR family methyltransferase [Stenotrophomonas tumulicola]MBA8683561.1 protein-glutamate O-methyltransferase CheR [Stenotrophomonas tumulicola]
MNEAELFDLELKVLVEAIYQRYHYDFRNYAVSSLRRRMRQAMQRYECERLADLQHRLLHEPDLFAQAMQFFTVQVSEMFRDPAYFVALREHAMPVLRTYPSIKLWVAGCSTGEEVWSLAILLQEEGLLDRSIIYATDINPAALSAAEAGTYGIDRIAQFSRNYLQARGQGSLSDYYTADYNGAVFDRRLRRNVVFADHSLATDTVFSEVQLVSCRNVLIYFNRPLQDRAVGLFREALVHRGFLGLGSKESLQFGEHGNAFEVCSREQRLYRKAA